MRMWINANSFPDLRWDSLILIVRKWKIGCELTPSLKDILLIKYIDTNYNSKQQLMSTYHV